MIGIRDPDIAFAFDVECEDILIKWETEREAERDRLQVEAITGQTLSSALGDKPAPQKNTVNRW